MIEISNIYKSFDGKHVLHDISLSIQENCKMVIVGCSGCGKTVLLRSIIGLIKPDKGNIVIDGENIIGIQQSRLYKIRKKFGMLFQGAALFDSMTVEENVGLALKEHTTLSESQIRSKVQSKLEMVGLFDVLDKKPAELSGGMKKRVGLARALIMDPKYILYDEPTTGLDPIMAETINNLINEMHDTFQMTSIIVTHDMTSASEIGDQVAMIYDGKIAFSGSVDIFHKSKNSIVRQFLDYGYAGQENKNTI